MAKKKVKKSKKLMWVDQEYAVVSYVYKNIDDMILHSSHSFTSATAAQKHFETYCNDGEKLIGFNFSSATIYNLV